MAGMMKHCDFSEQCSSEDSDGKKYRPDMVINLPDNRQVVVDAKAPLSAYLEAVETKDESRRLEGFVQHAALVKKHIQSLSQKAYWDQFENSPEFVVLFLPGENFFSAALEHDPSLIEVGATHKVLLATPISLLSILRSAAYGWKQQSISENAQKISKLGRELYGRISDFTSHMHDLGKQLNSAVGSYNKAVGTMESRLVVTARRLAELKAEDSKKIVKETLLLDQQARTLSDNF
jgi:DNA recombination protein RmuC